MGGFQNSLAIREHDGLLKPSQPEISSAKNKIVGCPTGHFLSGAKLG
jgi:hypothetical protein